MEILRLTPHYYFESGIWPPEFDPLGGMQNQITALTEGLDKKNVRQHIVTSGYPGAESYKKGDIFVYTVSKFRIRIKSKISGLLFFDLFWLTGTLKWLLANRKIMKNVNVVHHHFSGTYASIVVCFICEALIKKAQVVTIHCSKNYTYKPPSVRSRIMHRFLCGLEKLVLKKADKIILLTDSNYQNYIDAGIDNIIILGDQIPEYHLECSLKSVQNAAQKYKICHDKINIAFVGRVSFEKGCTLIPKIADVLDYHSKKNYYFWIIGDGPQLEDLKQKVNAQNLDNIFSFTGFISRLEIPSILRNMDILLVPSKHEEFGGVILEGVCAGLPIVTSGVGGIKQILGETYRGIVDTNDCASYVNKIECGFSNKKVGYDREEILSKYSPEMIVDSVFGLYEQLK